ncbi:hypothetical protein ACPA0O_19845 [Ectopseudomonas chengduensis]|nr:hypothetical protein [Pseudomonas sp. WS 5019]NMY17097.1 hypothetical protein [Pseudomonas sp. WS 5019]
MFTVLTRDVSNGRFIAYAVLLYILSLTAGSLIAQGGELSTASPLVKLVLLPLAQCFLLAGSRLRWPDTYPLLLQVSSAFYAGTALATFNF